MIKAVETIALGNGTVLPTIYHEGVEVVLAEEESSCVIPEETGECKQHYGTLTIRKEYTGQNPILKDWYLEYIFEARSHSSNWEFLCYNGTFNVEAVLPLKEEYYDSHYAF